MKTARAGARAIARGADGVVVGSALVDALCKTLDPDGKATAGTVAAVTDLVAELAAGVRAAVAALACGAGQVSRATDTYDLARRRVEVGMREHAMNWITNVVRPKIRSFLAKREVPENLWIKCPETGQMVFYQGPRGEPVRHPGLRAITCA